MNKNYNRILVEDTQGNRSYKGVYDPAREDVGITKKKPELTPKQKALLKNKTELTLYSEELGGYIHMYYVSNELLFNKVNIERANISRLIYLATYIDEKILKICFGIFLLVISLIEIAKLFKKNKINN